MPPKKNKQQEKPSKKKDNVDKTFGLKNKNRSTKVQKYIRHVHNQDEPGKEDLRRKKLEEKKLKEAAEAEKRALFNPIIDQRVRAGVDPKTVLCAMFKIGNCNKGARCKFSHDLSIGRKVEKRDLYQDARAEKEEDTMDSWDEEKLRKVILSKHGNPKTTTDKVCKFFIEAVENGKYGWFWVCPNGGDKCMYRHSLPEGFVLKTKEQKRLEREAFENQPKITLEDFIETERERLDKTKLTPITMDNFAEWKKRHIVEKINAEEKLKLQQNGGKKRLSGREIIQNLMKDKYNSGVLMDISVDEATEEEEEEGENRGGDHGSAWDLTEFTDALKEAERQDNSGIKDYGDGSNPTFEIIAK